MTRENVIAKYAQYRSFDPFPEIENALLNSADVFDYIETIGMVFPFDENQLKGVTLSLRIGDWAVYYNEKNEKVKKNIKEDKEFKLKSNSIAYVQIYEELHLPAYIIARFNLRVTNAYRGILLGTGPIVDPGFVGKLFIPLHNLTNNDYVFNYEEPLIEMEFTKLSGNSEWNKVIRDEEKIKRKGKYKKWEPTFDQIETDKRDLEYYLRRANQGLGIQSSLPPLANKVDKSVKSVKNHLRGYNIFLIFSFVGLLAVIAQMINIFRADIRDIRDIRIQRLDERIITLQTQNRNDSLLFNTQIETFRQQRRQDSLVMDSIKKKIKL